MIDLTLALKKRLERFILASSITTEEAAAGANQIKIRTADIPFFDMVPFMQARPKITVHYDVSNITQFHKVESVDVENGILRISPSLTDSLPSGSSVERTPGQIRFNRVYIGDIDTIYDIPSIIIEPRRKSREWMTLPTGSDERLDFSINVFVEEDGNEETTLTMLSAVQEIDDLLMADLHLRFAVNPESPWDRPYDSLVESIDYGKLPQGESAFVKGAQINFWAKTYIIRKVVTNETRYTQFTYHPGPQFPDQGIDTADTLSKQGIYSNIND